MKPSMIIFVTSLVSLLAHAQVENYFSQKGVVLLAQCAHPSNTFDHGTYEVEDGYVIVNIFYKENVHTMLRVNRGSNYFSRVIVLSDDDFFPPFKFLKNILGTILKQYPSSNAKDEMERNMENMLKRTMEDWNGTDWALLIINLDYMSR